MTESPSQDTVDRLALLDELRVIAVQLGFVVGALLSATFTLADVIKPRYLFAASSGAGALATVVIALVVESFLPAVVLRLLTGVALAGGRG